MIERLISISGVGPIEHTTPSVEMGPLTLIYSENGRGKSTVAMVLRSLRDGQSHFITERQRIGGTISPRVRIKHVARPNPFEFDGTNWNGDVDHIEIYDSYFVHTHIHSGTSVSRDHRVALNKFVIGETAVVLVRSVENCKGRIQEVNGVINRLKAELEGHRGPWQLDEFRTLPESDSISSELLEVQQSIATAKAAGQLAILPIPQSPSTTIQFDFLRARQILETGVSETIQEVVRSAEKLFSQLGPGSQAWVRQGLEQYFKDDDSCPLCGRDRNEPDRIELFLEYFGEAYRGLYEQVRALSNSIESALGPDARAQWLQAASNSLQQIALWQGYELPSVDIETPDLIARAFDEAYRSWRDLVAPKLDRPLASVSWDSNSGEAVHQLAELNGLLSRVARGIEEFSHAAQALKSQAAAADVAALHEKQARLEAARVRWTNDRVMRICNVLTLAEAHKRWLNRKKDEAADQLRTHAEATWRHYERDINRYLELFDCPFRLARGRANFQGASPAADYEFHLHGETIALSPGSGYHFGSTFSEGDKTTLALAFFLARIKRLGHLDQCVIVFDDPITSLGMHRREQTLEAIAQIVPQCRQTLVLTHDPYFARKLQIRSHVGNHRSYELSRRGRYSEFVPVDLSHVTKSEYARNREALANYLATGTGDRLAVARSIRPFLEANIRLRAPELLPEGKWLGEVFEVVRVAAAGSAADRWKPLMQELDAINTFSKRYHHETNPLSADTPPSDGELQTYCRRALLFSEGTSLP